MPRDLDSRPAMDCAELARSADAILDGEFDEREQAEAQAHLAVCGDCRRTLEALGRTRDELRRRLRQAMGPEAPGGRAPEALRSRISLALRRERRGTLRRLLSPLPVAAAAACAAGVALVLATAGPGRDPLADEVAVKHSRSLPLEFTAASVGPEAVPGWFRGKVDFNARPPGLLQAGARLLGGRISHIVDRPAAYVRYELPPSAGSGEIGLFIVEDPGRQLGRAGRELQVGPATVRLVNVRGYNVAVWRNDEIVYSLVSDLGEADLRRLVEATLAAPR